MAKKPWEAFTGITSRSFVPGLVKEARHVVPEELCDMREYRQQERRNACGGHDPIQVTVAYAQDHLAYNDAGDIISIPDRAQYLALTRERKVNKFGLSYRSDAKLYLHRTLADIVIGAAIHLYRTQGWTTILYDGLRTVDGAYKLYCNAADSDMESGLLSLPGQSAHNKGMAVDSMMIDKNSKEIDMGGHFDHLDMGTNGRIYNGDKISPDAKHHRRLREAAFLRSALTQGLLVAPLRNEFWDDRLPENHEDLWRVLDSAARCLDFSLLTPQDDALRKENRKAFEEKWERWDYTIFLKRWREAFSGQEAKLKEVLGVTEPPAQEKPEFYHGNYHPIYDTSLRASGKHLTEMLHAA